MAPALGAIKTAIFSTVDGMAHQVGHRERAVQVNVDQADVLAAGIGNQRSRQRCQIEIATITRVAFSAP